MKAFIKPLWLFLLCVIVDVDAMVADKKDKLAYDVQYIIALDPTRKGAQVSIKVDNHHGLLQQMVFKNNKDIYSNIRANGKLMINDSEAVWDLPEKEAQLNLFVKITHEKSTGKYDALMKNDWAIFRGDDVIPAMRTTEVPGAYAKAILDVQLPEGWNSIETGWPRLGGTRFLIDNPERLFDRPTGWMIAGKLGTRRATIKKTNIAVSAPAGEEFRRMDVLTFLSFAWREMAEAFEVTPDKLLVVGAGDPMWRGGLSASNSLFLHADRPMVSENGTSPIIHELTHMVTRVSGIKTATTNDDWIAEGIAEFYSFELLYRAKGMTKARRSRIIKNLAAWGKDVKHLRKSQSTGAVTARAVVLFDELDKEIRERSKGKYCLDHLVRELMHKRQVSLDDLEAASRSLVKGKPLTTLNSPLLQN